MVRQGRVAAIEWRWNATFADGRKMTHSVIWTSYPGLHGAKPTDASIAIVIRAIPDVVAAKPGFFAFPPLAPFKARF